MTLGKVTNPDKNHQDQERTKEKSKRWCLMKRNRNKLQSLKRIKRERWQIKTKIRLPTMRP